MEHQCRICGKFFEAPGFSVCCSDECFKAIEKEPQMTLEEAIRRVKAKEGSNAEGGQAV